MASKIVPKDVVGKVRRLVPKDPLAAAMSLLRKVTNPWTITGPAATPEFVPPVLNATEYRKYAPASMPVRPAIPQAEPDLVFNITYHTRDRKRSGKRTVQEVDPAALAKELDQGLPPTPNATGTKYVMGKVYHLDDEPGGGYQK